MTPRARALQIAQQLLGPYRRGRVEVVEIIQRGIEAAVREEREACARAAVRTQRAA
jgi:hypothetical protein